MCATTRPRDDRPPPRKEISSSAQTRSALQLFPTGAGDGREDSDREQVLFKLHSFLLNLRCVSHEVGRRRRKRRAHLRGPELRVPPVGQDRQPRPLLAVPGRNRLLQPGPVRKQNRIPEGLRNYVQHLHEAAELIKKNES